MRQSSISGRWVLTLALWVGAVHGLGCASDAEPEPVPATGGSAGAGGSGATGGTGASGGIGGSGGATGGTGATGGSGASGPDATIQVGAPDRFLLSGMIVTPDTTFEGQVLAEGDTLTCVKPGTECANEAGAQGATIIDTHGIIAPGLIDTHNHILFDIFGDEHWLPNIPSTCSNASDCAASSYCSNNKCNCVEGTCKYQNHNQWPNEREYGVMMDYKQCLEDASQGKPVWCPQTYKGNGKVKCEMDKWGELKGLIAGTTSIVGLPGTSSACFSSLSRSIDVAQNGLPSDKVQTSATFPPSTSSADGVCKNYSSGATEAYLIHCGEGVDATALKEFSTLYTVTTDDGCLYAPGTAITHGTSFTSAEYETMAKAGMKLTWSPASNVALYGSTNDLPAAIAAGLTISLAPDWSMGGSRNMLEEMRFANQWDDTHYGNVLSTKDIVEMSTSNAAAVIALSNTLGRLTPGFKADLFVVGGDVSLPYDAIVSAWPSTVRLVMVGGKVLYGDDQLEAAGPMNPGCEAIDVCGRAKFICVAEASSKDLLDQTLVEIRDRLNNALLDLDSIPVLPASSCKPACGANEECYERTVFAEADPSKCGAPCGLGEKCYQKTASTYGCMPTAACSPKREKKFHPVTPLFACP